MDSVAQRSRMTNGNAHMSALGNGLPLSGLENDHSSSATNLSTFGNSSTWGNIWGTSASSFAPAARENSRLRENGTHQASSDVFESKLGPRTLAAPSETVYSSPWNNTRRGSATSPPRRSSLAQTQSSQQLNNASSSAYYQPRNSSFAQNSISKPIKEPLDPTSASFTTTHHPDSFANDLSRFAFGQPDNTNGRSDPSATPWSDAASLHSPGDDRHSQAASEYFGSSSAAPSRSGSLPPSRHGETVQYPDKYARYAQANNRQTASFSVGHLGAYPERNGSFQSDSLAAYAQLLREQNLDGGSVSHRPSLSSTSLAHHVDRYATDPSTLRESTGAVHLPTKSDAYSQMATGTYTPEGQWQGGLTDANPQFRPLRFDGRSAHNASLSRQSPQYSNIHTPPNSDRYQFQAENAISNGANIAMVERKLVGLQQQQLQALNAQQYIPHQPHVQHLHMTTVPNMMPNARPYYYAVPNGVPVLPAYPVPYQGVPHSAPRGPKDQQQQCPMSQCLFEFKSFYQKTNKKYTLKDIYNHVVEFSGDQAGSRFIQNEIAQANSEEKQRVFSEIIVDARQLMTDVFGNYVIQKFFEFGDQTQKRLLANTMKGHISELSTNTYGCRVVQKALEHVLTEQQIELIRELQKEVLYCVKNANGNHVIQKAIERIPAKHIQFIMDSFKGNVASLSVEQYGCRVIQRVLEYCEPQTTRFVLDEIHADEERILSHQFGNYVTQHVLKHGSPEDRTKIIELIKTDIVKYSNHKFASNVVEACFLYGSDEQRREIVLKVKERNQRGESNISRLIKDQFGNYVIQKILDQLPREDFMDFAAVLKPEIELHRKNIATKQLTAIEEKLHRFDHINAPSSGPAQRNSMSSTTESLGDVPSLVNEAQSPQSTDVPSAPSSTIDDLAHANSTEKILPALASLNVASDTK